ncbi:MAG: hypothetical protein GWM98_30500, partial [Nitrospinaceae bacterium]|nr:hypothetical protein [Nitrospinaceae bacterium]NIR57998.1 hypothetical protein [Nitrospinaceae bacterium]NIS88460.1 hypothetical protein [Nitrospinaceae bacterium]NIT85340.1 hypothetical protein [Nitrospinaceae bacterium]NIU47491.1 hypothetical protein [Nitrospinaceae bacterium]
VLQAQDQECGEKILPPKVYEQASLYSLIAGFTLVIAGILIDRKPVKFAVWGLALVPLVI